MKVLLLSANYTPEVTGIAPFSTGLAEHLRGAGHDVRVCSALPHFPEWRLRPSDRRTLFAHEQIEGVLVRRSRPLLPGNRMTTGRRILYDTSLAAGALLCSLPGPRPDVIIAVSPPAQTALVAGLLGLLWKRPTIVWVKDLVVDAAEGAGMMKSSVSRRIGQTVEAAAFRTGTKLVTIGEGMRDRIATLSGRTDTLVIPDWANLADDTEPAQPTEDARGGRPLAIYAGNLGNKMGTPLLVDTASQCPEIDFVIIGEGAEKESVKQQIAKTRATNVQMLGLLPRHEYQRWIREAQYFLLCQKAEIRQSVFPSKLLGYMSAGRPVVAAVSRDSEAGRIIADASCGLVVEPEDPVALAAALRELVAHPEEAVLMGQRGRRYALQRFDKIRILETWTELIQDLRRD